jgi:hypothetical protein
MSTQSLFTNRDELDFVVFANPVYCVDVSRIANDSTTKFNLLKALFFANEKPQVCHYHFNSYSNEEMLIISKDPLEIFESNQLTALTFKKYFQIQMINTNAYLNDTGLVSTISTVFANNNISILYVTTCQSNFIYVELSDYDKTFKCLQTLGKTIIVD